jgi:Asp-tRNA(Asn)/Glu-tRNA(Gln) amidotransferase B subunit
MEHSRATIKGPGLGEKVNELRDHLKASIKLVSSLAAELHSSARFHNNSNHDTTSWKKCKSWLCNDARHFIEQLETEIPELKHNPHALRQYRTNLRKLQKAIKSAPPDLT